ncbi:myosin-10 isoform X2 [Agrilus planipennis]|uniref:Myosin-10 isoform X2 n=1 Tax=Agrilus planipennis TaxID=224129 RepID=A0A1W4X8F9_AGRPL|nr:myosin-10 isoform X2 [Agrilus planipennis]
MAFSRFVQVCKSLVMDDLPLRECSSDNLISNNSVEQESTEHEALVTNEKGIYDSPVITHPRLSILTEFDPLFKSASDESIIKETFPEEVEVSSCKDTPDSSLDKNKKDGLYSKLLDITATNTTQENVSNFIQEQENSLASSDDTSKSDSQDNIKDCTFDENKNPTTNNKLLDTFCLEDKISLEELDNKQNKDTSRCKKDLYRNTESVEDLLEEKTQAKPLHFKLESQEDDKSINAEDNQIDCNIKCSFNLEETESQIRKTETPIKVLSEITHCIQNTSEENKDKQDLLNINLIKSRKSLPAYHNNSIFERKKNHKRHSLPHNIEKNVGIVKASPKILNNTSDGQNIEALKEKKTNINMDISDNLEEENSDLKLQLNASQQERATLELEIRQKEEVIIKTQAELIRKEQAYKQEIKQLKQKLEEKSTKNDSENINELEETIKNLKAREARLLSEINTLAKEENSFKKIMAEFEINIQEKVNEIQKLKEEHETVKRHLANLELAFSDVHQKYERSKNIIERYKLNEEALLQRLAASEEMVQKSEEKYDSLKAHAKAQIEKIGKEMANIRESNDMEIHKLQAIIKRLEIKNASLMVSLDQKNKECLALTALCDEVTGKV